MHTTTTPSTDTSNMPACSPSAVLSHILESEPLIYTRTGAGTWDGPFAFEFVLGLLFYNLVAIHEQGNVAMVVVTHRGASFVRNEWNDQEIVAACRRLRWQTRGSMVVQ